MMQVDGAVQVAMHPLTAAASRRRPNASLTGPRRWCTGLRRRAGAETAKPEPAPADERRDPDPADRRHSRLDRTDEAGPGQDGSGQGRLDQVAPRPAVGADPLQSRSPGSRLSRVATRRPPNPGSVIARPNMPPQPANFGTGQGILGVLPASERASPPTPQTLAQMRIPAPKPNRRRSQPQAFSSPEP